MINDSSFCFSHCLLACGYVGGQIYCFGGDRSSSLTANFDIDNKMHHLNISQFIGHSTDSMSSHWNTVNPATTFDPELRRAPASIILPDGKTFLIQGGYNVALAKYINQTIAFDTSTNTFTSAPAYSETTRGIRQMYSSTQSL
jgi:hypothetical protein